MAKLKKRNWHDRNYPPRGTAVSGLVKEMNLKPDEVVYIGGKTFSSGFHWIGRFKDVPEEYGNLPVVETYRRTVDYPGTILLSDALTKNGQYWNWNECDSTVKPAEILHQLEHSGAEQLLIAIARNEAHDYRDKLRSALRGNHDPDKVKKAIKKVRELRKESLRFLSGTSRGDYIIQRTEDEAYAFAIHPELDKLPYEKRYDIIRKEVEKLVRERVRANEDELYAHIKGRSVRREGK